MSTVKKYKWATPGEWLLEQIDNEWTPEQIQDALRQLVLQTDSDTLQDLFQDDMDTDGYFEPEGE